MASARVTTWLKEKVWNYVKTYPLRVVVSATVGVVLGSSPFVFSFERLLLKSRLHFGLFVPKDEKFQKGKFKETASSKMLEKIISPEVEANSYYMITGEHGIGKSSASVHIADMLGHRGIVHVTVPDSGDPKEFEKSLAERLFLYHLIDDEDYKKYLFFAKRVLDFPRYDGAEKASYLTILMNKLCVLSNQYERWHDGKGLVLVIDQINHFLKQGEKGKFYLDVLQDTAKSLADRKEIKIVFISSEGEAFGRMVNRSAISRAFVVEFQEATEEEAFQFLQDRLGEVAFNENKKELEDIVKNYSGGKFKTLVDVVNGVKDLKGMKKKLHDDAKKHLTTFGMHGVNDELEKEMKDKEKKEEERRKAEKALVLKDIGNRIVKNGTIDRGLVISKILGTMGEEELRRTNVFAYHHSTDSYSFATRALKTVYKEMTHLGSENN